MYPSKAEWQKIRAICQKHGLQDPEIANGKIYAYRSSRDVMKSLVKLPQITRILTGAKSRWYDSIVNSRAFVLIVHIIGIQFGVFSDSPNANILLILAIAMQLTISLIAIERVLRGFDLKFVSLTMITYWASLAVGALLRELFYFLAVLMH